MELDESKKIGFGQQIMQDFERDEAKKARFGKQERQDFESMYTLDERFHKKYKRLKMIQFLRVFERHADSQNEARQPKS